MHILHALCKSQHCFNLIDVQKSSTRAILLMRQKEYKLAALKAKQQGDLEKAKEYMKAGKVSTEDILNAKHTLYCMLYPHALIVRPSLWQLQVLDILE